MRSPSSKLETAISLLTREGAVTVRFDAMLTLEQYIQLHEAVRGAETKEELKERIELTASVWLIAVEVDDGA